MVRFVAKTLRVINVLDLGTEAVVVAVTGEVSFDNRNKTLISGVKAPIFASLSFRFYLSVSW